MKKIFILCVFALISTTIFAQTKMSNILTNKKVDEICTTLGMTRETITDFYVSDEFTVIDDYAFEGCTLLKKIELNSNVIQIGIGAFAKTAITELIIPPSVISIGKYAFGKTNLKFLTILCQEPPQLSTELDVFYTGGINNEIIIFVPDEFIEKYIKSFKNQNYIKIKPLSLKNNNKIDKSNNTISDFNIDDKPDVKSKDILIAFIFIILFIILIVYIIKKAFKNMKK